jgi:hypothetical protein
MERGGIERIYCFAGLLRLALPRLMTDYVITNGRIPSYPATHFGGHFATASRATFCLPADLVDGLDANTLAIPGLPITVLTSSPVITPETFYGMHVQKRANDNLAGVTAKIVRSHDMANGKGRWQFIQPTSSTDTTTWDLADLDSWVDTHYAAGRELVFVLFGTPTWASARPTEANAYSSVVGGVHYNEGIAAEPSDLTVWDTYCTTIATRYKGKIRYYEVWNEVNLSSGATAMFTGTNAVLSEMVRRANQAIKAVDPLAKIVSPSIQGWVATANQASETFFTDMMAASDGANGTMAAWVDIIAVHLYLPAPNKVQDLAGVIDRVNAAKTTAGISALETWDTESAPISPDISTLADDQAKSLIARDMITKAAKGIARSIFYQYDHATMGFMGRPQIQQYREQIATVLRSGRILNAHRFTDGRVAYATESGLTII